MRTKKSYDDEQILEGIRNDESWAIGYLYKKPSKIAFGILLNKGISSAVIPDLLQEVIISFCDYVKPSDFTISHSLEALFYNFVRLKGLKYIRDRKPQHDLYRQNSNPMLHISEPLQGDSLRDENRNLRVKKVMDAIGEFKPEVQKILLLKYAEGLRYREIAEELYPHLFNPDDAEGIRKAVSRLTSRCAENFSKLKAKLGIHTQATGQNLKWEKPASS